MRVYLCICLLLVFGCSYPSIHKVFSKKFIFIVFALFSFFVLHKPNRTVCIIVCWLFYSLSQSVRLWFQFVSDVFARYAIVHQCPAYLVIFSRFPSDKRNKPQKTILFHCLTFAMDRTIFCPWRNEGTFFIIAGFGVIRIDKKKHFTDNFLFHPSFLRVRVCLTTIFVLVIWFEMWIF